MGKKIKVKKVDREQRLLERRRRKDRKEGNAPCSGSTMSRWPC